jgi:hypothetical protein
MSLNPENVVPMKQDMAHCKKTLDWLISIAAAVGAPLALMWAGSAREIADAFQGLGNGAILRLVAAANALTVIP